MNWSQNRLALLVALLLVARRPVRRRHGDRAPPARQASGAERRRLSRGKSSETSAEKKAKGESSGKNSGETNPAESASPTVASGESGGETHSEKIAGVDPSRGRSSASDRDLAAGRRWRLLAAGSLARRGRRIRSPVRAGDIRELVHQVQESRTTVASIAGVLIGSHLLIAGAGAFMIWLSRAQGGAITEPS